MEIDLLRAVRGYIWAFIDDESKRNITDYRKAIRASAYLLERFTQKLNGSRITLDKMNEFIASFNMSILSLFYSSETAGKEYRRISELYSSDEKTRSIIALVAEIVDHAKPLRVRVPEDNPWFLFGAATAFLRSISPDLYSASLAALVVIAKKLKLNDETLSTFYT